MFSMSCCLAKFVAKMMTFDRNTGRFRALHSSDTLCDWVAMDVVAMAISLGAAVFLDTSDLPNKATARKFAWDLSHSLTTGGRNTVALE